MNNELIYYLSRRLMQIPIVLFLASIVVFYVIHLPEGGPIRVLLGQGATEELIAEFEAQYHLDQPLYEQYWHWITNVLTGDFGQSIFTSQEVSVMIIERLPVTLLLATLSILLAVTIAIPAGYISAIEHHTWKDNVATVLAFIGLSIPNFFLAIILIKIFAMELGVMPIRGELFEGFFETIQSLLLPSIALGTALAAQTTRHLRSSMVEIHNKEYVNVARAKGLPQKVINRGIIFKNALVPVITIVGLQFGFLLGGTVVIEEIFSLPGLDRLMLNSVLNRDFPVMQAVVLFYAVAFMVVNLIADILYSTIDPRIRYQGEKE